MGSRAKARFGLIVFFAVLIPRSAYFVHMFEGKLALGTAAMIGSGLLLCARGRARSRMIEEARPGLLGSLAN